MNEENKKRRGRPAGVSSFKEVTIEELNDMVADGEKVVVSVKWLANRAAKTAEPEVQ